jgi:hypothetical protein
MVEAILGMGFVTLLIVAIIWWLPIILILKSDKTNGAEKFVWILLIFFFSWFSWILYALLAPIGKKSD